MTTKPTTITEVKSETLEVIAKLADTEAKLSVFRDALEYVVAARDKVTCRCGSHDLHNDDCPIGYAINTLAK